MEKEFVKSPIAAGVVIEQDGKYLLVQESTPSQYGLWNWPAGKVDVGETIEEAAIREGKEETGYNVEIIRKLGIWQDNTKVAAQHALEAKIVGGEFNFPKGELLDAKWFTKEEIYSMKDKLRTSWVIGAIEILENNK